METIDNLGNTHLLSSNLKELLKENSQKAIAAFQRLLNNKPALHSFEIDCSLLDRRFYKDNNVCESTEFKAIFDVIIPIEKPFLYWFEILSDTGCQTIIEAILKYKNEANPRATPALKKNLQVDSRTLYVGKVKNNFYGRVVTHLGYLKGSGNTQGLQLDSWAKDLGLKLRLQALEFEHEMADFIAIIEFAFAKQLRPILGKHK